MNKRKHKGSLLRLLILVLLLAGALQVYRWSRTNDPRFYLFLQSRPGRVLARIFHWGSAAAQAIPEDKPAEELTETERAVMKKMREKLLARQARYRLVTAEGRELTGWIVESNSQYVVFEEKYGASGALQIRIPAAKISILERLPARIPPITYRDIRFQMEFPSMQFYKKPPYSILTDESYFHVERSVRTLQELHTEFMRYFRPLLSRRNSPLPSLQVLFFSDEEQFHRYQKRYCRIPEPTAGFYSPTLRRLVIYNEKRSGWLRDLEEDLRKSAEESGLSTPQAALRKRKIERALLHEAEEKTFVTLRHEGAHQLFFAYGVHSDFRVENDWLIEGLAVFMETRPAGRKDPRRVSTLRKAAEKNRLIPLKRLMDYRHVRGFLALGSSAKVELAYCQAWALVRYLMSDPGRRNAFFEYIRYVRDPRHLREILHSSRLDLLARFLRSTPEKTAREYRSYISRL